MIYLTRYTMYSRRSCARLLSTLLCIGMSLDVGATVVSGASRAYGESVNLTVAPVLGAAVNVQSGPLPVAFGSAPSRYAASTSVASATVTNILHTGIINVGASSNINGNPGSVFASATADVHDLSLLGLLGINLTATEILSSALISGDFGSLSLVGNTTLVGLVLNGIPFVMATPPPNTILFDLLGLTITLNEQIVGGDLNNPSLMVNAIDINFNNFLAIEAASIINGKIIISHSEASLTARNNVPVPVPEPGTIALLLLAGAGLIVTRRKV